jgi:hypothetical protein
MGLRNRIPERPQRPSQVGRPSACCAKATTPPRHGELVRLLRYANRHPPLVPSLASSRGLHHAGSRQVLSADDGDCWGGLANPGTRVTVRVSA